VTRGAGTANREFSNPCVVGENRAFCAETEGIGKEWKEGNALPGACYLRRRPSQQTMEGIGGGGGGKKLAGIPFPWGSLRANSGGGGEEGGST